MNPFDTDDFEPTIAVGPKRGPEQAPVREVFGNYLVVIAGADAGKRVEITDTPITIGRDARQTLVFDDTQLSRLHARVSLVNGEVVVEDLKSTNGTFLDGVRLTEPATLREGQVVRMGGQLLTYERRSRRDIDRAEELDRDLQRASKYVFSLLPEPITSGLVRADWRFVPSTQLGGDAFGYYWLDPQTFVFYLLDVSGHGAGSAMHSVTVLNVLRQRALPDVDFRSPAAVLTSLNARFPMDSHGGLFFTMWYGVYDARDRTLRYASAGHHPAFLVTPERQAPQPLGMSALMIGAFGGYEYKVAADDRTAGQHGVPLQRRGVRNRHEGQAALGDDELPAPADRAGIARRTRGGTPASRGHAGCRVEPARGRLLAHGGHIPVASDDPPRRTLFLE